MDRKWRGPQKGHHACKNVLHKYHMFLFWRSSLTRTGQKMKFKKSDQSLFRMDKNRNQLTQVHLENQHVHVIQCIYVYVLNSVTISPQ